MAGAAKRRAALVGTLRVHRREKVRDIVEGGILVLVDSERREASMVRLLQSRCRQNDRCSSQVRAE